MRKYFPIPVVFVISLVVMGLVVGINFTRLPPEIPLLYSRPLSSDQIQDTLFIAVIPIVIVFFVLINSFLSRKLFSDSPFVQDMIYYTNIFVIVSFTYIFSKIVLLVT